MMKMKKIRRKIMNEKSQVETKKRIIGVFLFLVPIIFILLIIWLWPTRAVIPGPAGVDVEKDKIPAAEEITGDTGTAAGQPGTQLQQNIKKENENKEKYEWSKRTNLIFKRRVPFELRMILLVLLAGALGSYIHMATSFSYFIGMGKFEISWCWWYWLRLPIGAALALIFSMLIQGGIFAIPAAGSEANPVGVIGFAGLIGMFSRQAIDKLKDIFDTTFKSTEQDKPKNEGDNKKKLNGQ
jgi:hypothetical protein